MEKMVNLFFLLGFNYLMFKSWGTQKVTLLTVFQVRIIEGEKVKQEH